MPASKFSRRHLVISAASLAATLLAACSKPESTPGTAIPSPAAIPSPPSMTPTVVQRDTRLPTNTPTPVPTSMPTPVPPPKIVNVWVDPANPARFRPAAERLIAQIAAETSARPVDIERVATTDQADVSFATTKTSNPTGSMTLAKTYLVPVCSPRTPVRSLTAEQITALLSGTARNWSDAGSPTAIPAQPFVIDGLRIPGTADSAIGVSSFDEFVSHLDDNPGAIALAALDDVDFRALSILVDGVDLLAVPEPPTDWPFAMYLYVSARQGDWALIEGIVASDGESESPTTGTPPLTVTFVGDVILGRTVHTIMTRLNDYTAPFKLVADELKDSDLTIADLECSLADDITPPTDPYTFSFMTFTAGADGLALAGVDAVSQANNHSMNFGAKGMRDTLAALDQRNIEHFGIGENLSEARKPVIFDTSGRKIAFLGYDGITATTYGATSSSPGTAPLDAKLMAEDIAAVRQQADIVIPFVHWGIEYQLVPSREQQAIARNAIDVGADMVVGSHCHWVQGIEIYHGKPIIYSLANFVFDQDWSLETKQGLIMHLVFRENRIAALRFVPVLIEDFYQPHIVDGTDMTQILDRVWQSTDLIKSTL